MAKKIMLIVIALFTISATAVDREKARKHLDEKLETYRAQIRQLKNWIAEGRLSDKEAIDYAINSVYIPGIRRVLQEKRALGLAVDPDIIPVEQ